jgi:hypothetical protein
MNNRRLLLLQLPRRSSHQDSLRTEEILPIMVWRCMRSTTLVCISRVYIGQGGVLGPSYLSNREG